MKWLYRNLHKKEKGFTLVELMVVIIILAVLTAVFPHVSGTISPPIFSGSSSW